MAPSRSAYAAHGAYGSEVLIFSLLSRHLRARFWRVGAEQAQRQQTQNSAKQKEGTTPGALFFYRWK
jgi:hypothetical protein